MAGTEGASTMARAWEVESLRARMSLREVARRVLAVRVAEFYSFAPFIHDPARVTELHDMRIAAKRLRYTLEIFSVALAPEVEAALDQVKALQELLGEIHDADVLEVMLRDRLASIERDEAAALLARLHEEASEAARLGAIRAQLAPRGDHDRRLGIYALLGRTIHRRRRRYADFLDRWARLETRGFRRQLEALTRRPARPAENGRAGSQLAARGAGAELPGT
jgi:hypothetical protein